MNLVVIGAQWGDEGKGKIVDYLAAESELTVRYSGGANAGHTIVVDDKTYKLHLIPSGVVYPQQTVVLGSGMVIDLESMFKELTQLKTQGINWEGRIFISDRAHIVLPQYKDADIAQDKSRKRPIGTTGRGIGIAYSLKASRDGVRIADLWDEAFFNSLDKKDQSFLNQYKDKLQTMLVNLEQFMRKQKDKKTLFEGAQGALLDLDTGTYPYVSSGYSCSAGASLGGGIGPRSIDKVLGVFKAYTTRVGNGPFPSEFDPCRDGNLDTRIREIGNEYGVTTGRARRCGFLDLVALKYSTWINSIDALVLTHLDVYDSLETLQVCVAYEIDGITIDYFPTRIDELERAKPVLKSFKGWQKDISSAKSINELPAETMEYLNFIADYVETPIDVISVGADRKQTFMRKNLWTK